MIANIPVMVFSFIVAVKTVETPMPYGKWHFRLRTLLVIHAGAAFIAACCAPLWVTMNLAYMLLASVVAHDLVSESQQREHTEDLNALTGKWECER